MDGEVHGRNGRSAIGDFEVRTREDFGEFLNPALGGEAAELACCAASSLRILLDRWQGSLVHLWIPGAIWTVITT